jgi:RNA polymerase sigma factor (TIGR02999 family)
LGAAEMTAALYSELHRLAAAYMRRERTDHTLQPTALVHEAYLRLAGQRELNWRNRAQLIGVAAQVMRRVLLDHARKHFTNKRGGKEARISLDTAILGNGRHTDIVALDDALTQLAAIDPRQSRIVELRFFGGLTEEETADLLDISSRTVRREWTMARAWLFGVISSNSAGNPLRSHPQ